MTVNHLLFVCDKDRSSLRAKAFTRRERLRRQTAAMGSRRGAESRKQLADADETTDSQCTSAAEQHGADL